MREAKSSANCTSWGNKVVSVVLSAILLGFGWPAVNPAEVYAEDGAANGGGSSQLSDDAANLAATLGGGDDAPARPSGESVGISSPALVGVESDIAGDSGDSNTPSATNNESGKAADSSAVADAAVAQSLSITGADTVAQFSTMQLTATTSPTNAEGTYVWSSNNDNILTVDQSGTVTGVRQGAATVTLNYTSPDGATTLTATHDVTVTSPTAATNSALFYYLNNPNGSLDSTSTTQWTSLGSGSVNLTGLSSSNFPKDNGKTAVFDRVSDRVITWPDGSTGDEYQVARGSSDWNNIFKAYKSVIEGMLPGVTVTDEDVESICVKPYKLTNNNDGYHVDCSVSITCRNLFNARYYVDDPTTPGEGFQLVASKLTYREGDTTDIADFADVSLPPSKTVGGIEYTFNGWYTDQALTQQVELPYTVDGNVNFYAKYLSGRQVIYDLAGGSWNNSDALVHAAQEGSTQTVKAEPTRVGHEFAGWIVSGLDGVTTLESGASFTMPDNNVTLTATWIELPACKVKYLEKGTDKELSPSDTLYGHAGDVVTADAKDDIEGYHLVDPSQASGKATLVEGEAPEIVFYYEKDAADYQVNYYLNGTEQKVADSETLSAPWGSEVAASDLAKGIDGYTAVPGQTATATVELDGSTVINVYYYQNVTLTANSATREYTGEQQRVEGYTCDVAEATFAGVSLLGGRGTDAGDYPYAFAAGAVGTVSADGKYIVAKTNDGKLLISANSQQIVVKIKGNTGGGKYDGTEQSVEGYAVSYVVGGAASIDAPAGFDAGDISFAGAAKATGADAGSYPMGLKAGDFSYGGKNFSNVSFEVEDGRLDISKRALIIKPKDASRVYNGEALTASEWEVVEGSPDQFLAGQGIVDPVFSGSQTAPGTSESSIVGWGYQEGTKAGNYEIRTEKGTLNVTSRGATETITVEANSTMATYDGKSHSAVGLKATEFVVGGKTYTVSGLSTEDPSATDAGTYTNNITGTAKVTDAAGNDVTGEFDVEVKDGSLAIDPAEVIIKPKDASKPYDGTSLVASEFTATGFVGGDGITGVTYGGSQLNFGESESTIAGFAAAGSTKLTNYRITLGKGKLEVTANAERVVVTIRENSATFPYDGEAKTVEGYEVAKISSALYKESDFAFAGDAAHKVATGTDAGDYDMGLLAGDFENRSANFSNVVFEIEDGQLHIVPGEIDKDAVTWDAHDVQKVYDGEPLSAYRARAWDKRGNELSVEYSTDGETWVSDPSKISLTHFGHLAVKLRATGANYAAGQYATGSESVAITKRLVTLESEGADKTYDGTPLTNGAVSVTPKGEGVGFVDGEGVALTVTGSQTDVGESDNTFVFSFNEGTSGDDYLVTAKCGKLKVAANAAGVVVKIKGNTGGGKYDGTEHVVEGYAVSYVVGGAASTDAPAGFDAGDISFAGAAKAAGTDAGSYPMGLKAGDFSYGGKNFSNVSFEVEDGRLVIDPATLTVTTRGASKPYDGTALTAPGEISGFENGETASFAANGSQTLVGASANSYAIAWDGTAKESNYNVVEGAIGTLEVTPSQVAITVTPRDGSKVYDGKPLTSAGIDVNGLPAGFTLEAATKGTITDAGELLAAIDASTIVIKNAAGEDVTAQFANVTCGKAPLIVTKRPVTVTSATDSKVYDGAALTKHEATVTAGSLVEGESFGYDFTGEQTAVGSSDNTFTVKAGANTSLDNYEITQVSGTLTVIAYTPPAPGPGTDEPTPGPGKNPSTPNGPTNSSDVTPSGSTTPDDMGSVPTATDSKATTTPKSADKATSGNDAQSEERQSPDSASGAEQPTSCWVHWLMILGTIATLVYGAVVSLRRRRMTAALDKEMDAVLSGAKEGSDK
ncbi:InlB B-repeat-containing protein [uncultured Ellagibacter sp.]|uniref:InlB B-repeat-containing protein n=1 Tax=uncultured Ellagibacter sp. TaxID=2137580 RepID=UPI00261C271A|nr:InlB B-repeat-containing protein [uncultured Ellagibacter sp.]